MPPLLRRVPAPLLLLLAVCVIEALAWCVVVPPLQGPDEVSHVAYVQKMVEARELPWRLHGAPDGSSPYSTELGAAEVLGGARSVYGNPSARPLSSSVDERLLDQTEAGFSRAQRADGGFTSALKNPPAYYVYEALAYVASYPMGILDQVFVMRLANIPFLLLTVVGVWLVAGELLGRRRWLQTLATGAAVLQPQLMNVAATVNPDIMLVALWTVALHLMIVIVRRGLTRRRAGALIALCVLAAFTHGRGIPLIVPALLAIGLAFWKARWPQSSRNPRVVIPLAVVGALGGVAVFGYIALRGHLVVGAARQLVSYLWRYYLPAPEWLTALGPLYGFRDVSVDRLFGGFAQLEIGFSPAVNGAIWTGLLAVGLSAAFALFLDRRALLRSWDVAAVLLVAVLSLLAVLHAVAYRSLAFGPGDPIIAGRYLLVFIALYGVAIAFAVAWLPRRLGVAVGGALLAVLTTLQLAALGITVERFYA